MISVLRKASDAMIDDLIARLAAAGWPGLTRSHQSVFENLDRSGTRLTVLAARAGMTHQSMSELVSTLEERGYVERRTDPRDRRARLVHLTDKGRQMARRGLREMSAIEAEWREHLSEQGVKGQVVDAISSWLDNNGPAPADL